MNVQIQFPQYFLVDDIAIKVDFDQATGEVFAINSHGIPYPPAKALEGSRISDAQFESESKKKI